MGVNQSSGILAIWHDMVPEHEQALNDWYNQEHHAERVAVMTLRFAAGEAADGAPEAGLYQLIFTMGG